MEVDLLRKELHKLIDTVDEDRLMQIYIEIIESGEKPYELSAEEWTQIEERREAYLKGDGHSYSWEEVKTIILSRMHK